MTQRDAPFDLVIAGGGLVGSALAAALGDTPLSIALVEAAQPPLSVPRWDERCIALNDASRRILGELGLWDAVAPEAEPILATHISERGRFGIARFAAEDAGVPALGFNVPLRALGAVLWARLRAAPRVTLFCPARVAEVEASADSVRVQLASGDGTVTSLRARLLAAADGAGSAVRRALGIEAETRDYAQHAIVSALRLARPHAGVAYERFMPGGPLALIPKKVEGDGVAASLVWTRPSTDVPALLAAGDADYLAQAQDAFGGRLGRFLELGARQAYPLARTMAARLTAPRSLLLGNAAQSLHPVAAQGFNLGLRDVAQLARALREAADPGAPDLLAAYAQARSGDRARVAGLTDTMVRTFSSRVPGLAQARHWGLVAVDLLPGLRESVMRSHLGHRGLPRSLVS